VRRLGEEFVSVGKLIVLGEFSKAMGHLEDRSLIVKCSSISNFKPCLGIEERLFSKHFRLNKVGEPS